MEHFEEGTETKELEHLLTEEMNIKIQKHYITKSGLTFGLRQLIFQLISFFATFLLISLIEIILDQTSQIEYFNLAFKLLSTCCLFLVLIVITVLNFDTLMNHLLFIEQKWYKRALFSFFIPWFIANITIILLLFYHDTQIELMTLIITTTFIGLLTIKTSIKHLMIEPMEKI